MLNLLLTCQTQKWLLYSFQTLSLLLTGQRNLTSQTHTLFFRGSQTRSYPFVFPRYWHVVLQYVAGVWRIPFMNSRHALGGEQFWIKLMGLFLLCQINFYDLIHFSYDIKVFFVRIPPFIRLTFVWLTHLFNHLLNQLDPLGKIHFTAYKPARIKGPLFVRESSCFFYPMAAFEVYVWQFLQNAIESLVHYK